ncbi:MAG: hypothetical protein ACYCXQ_13820 [Candidatus Humimicrobiaceae bacterium]
MKNLLRKIKNLRLFKETTGEIILTTVIVMGVLFVFGTTAEWVSTLQPHTYAAGENREGDVTELANESAASSTITEEEPEVIIQGPVFTKLDISFLKNGSGDPDPTLNNKFSEEVVLSPEEGDWGQDQTLEEMFGGTVEFEYIKAISDENKENQSKESESDKISDENTKKQLAQNQLPDDKLSIDIYNSIENLVSENIKSDQLDDIGNISAQLLKDLFSKGEETPNNEEDVLKSIKDDLNEKKLLAEEEVISKRKYVKLLQQAKEEYEQRVAVIDKLGPDSVWTQNLIDYKNDKRIIDDLNMKISEADDFINNYETEVNGENTDQFTTTSETEQTTTISSDTSTTMQSTTLSTDLAATTIESTTTTSGTTTTTAGSTSTTENLELPEYISLYGSIGGYSNSMNLTINLKTGNVSGGINLVYSQTETSGDTTKTCSYSIKGSISGQMDLETRQINGSFSGSATALTEGCYGKDLSYSISGKLNENYSAANGSASNGWSWSVYK